MKSAHMYCDYKLNAYTTVLKDFSYPILHLRRNRLYIMSSQLAAQRQSKPKEFYKNSFSYGEVTGGNVIK